MPSHSGKPLPRGRRSGRQLRPCLLRLEERVVPSIPGIAGITFDNSGDVLVSYNSTTSSQQQSVAAFDLNYNLINATVFTTPGSPGALATVGSTAAIPSVDTNDILELQPDGQLIVFNPESGTSSQYGNLTNYTASATKVFDVQSDAFVDLTDKISLTGATYGSFGIDNNSLVISAESNNWDLVLRLTYGSSGGAATVLVASPASDGLSASPEGIAVDDSTGTSAAGTVLTTLPYVPAGSSTPIHVPVGFNLFYDTQSSPAPSILTLGLSSAPNIDAGGVTFDGQNSNFLVAATSSSLYGGGPGTVHVNAALTAFLAVPYASSESRAIPSAIAYQSVQGTDYLAYTDANSNLRSDPDAASFTIGTELPLFSGQASPAKLREAYGIDQISFTGPGGTTVKGDGSGQTIAIVELGVDPTLGADLNTFDQLFGISAPPSFQIVDQNGVTTQNLDIVGEASLDVEWAHAIAPGASIIVYNAAFVPGSSEAAATANIDNLMAAMQQASILTGVSVVTLSYGIPEDGLTAAQEQSFDSDFTTPGVTFLAASGDQGIYGDGNNVTADYPSASPKVVSVGGTSIVIDSNGDYPGTGASGEVAWGEETQNGFEGGGGGLSAVEPEPVWQTGVVPASMDPSDARALPDVSIDSGAGQEYDVFTSTLAAATSSENTATAEAVGWLGDAGTSGASPIWAGLIAIADQGRTLAGGTPLTGYNQTLPALYSLSAADFHDIVNGNNGDPAEPGYDLATGRGTPIANLVVPALARYDLPGNTATKVVVTASPAAPVAGQAVTFEATVSVVSPGTGVPTGTVTFVDGSTTLGTATLSGGVAKLSTTLTTAGPETITITYGGDPNDQPATTTLPLTVGQGTATLRLDNLSLIYDGSAQSAVVTTTPAGISGVTLNYSQNGVGVANPTRAGSYTVTATLDNPNFTAAAALSTLVIGQATPTLIWAVPANITVGTPVGAAELDATASFNGTPLPGVLTYNLPAGTVLPTGSGQTLMVSFAPIDNADFKSVTASVPINVLPPAAIIISEQSVFQRKLNKRGKPVGKPVLTGFTLDFNMALNTAAVSDADNYRLDTVTTKKVKGKPELSLQPIKKFTVTYSPGTDSATLKLVRTQLFPTGGRITVLPNVTGSSGSVLSGKTVFTITPGGKKIKPL